MSKATTVKPKTLKETQLNRMGDLLKEMGVKYEVQIWDTEKPNERQSNYQPGDVSITIDSGSGYSDFVCRFDFDVNGQAKEYACFR